MVSYVENGDGAAGDPAGRYDGDLVGHGSLLAYATWTQCDTGRRRLRARAASRAFPTCTTRCCTASAAACCVAARAVLHPVWTDGNAILIRHSDNSCFCRLARAGC